MMYNTIFYIIILFISLDFILDRVLNYLNRKNLHPELPEELRDVYDSEQYRKQQEYKRVNDRFSFLVNTFNFILILLMLFFEGFSVVDHWARQITQHPLLIPLVFFAMLGLAADLINTPFAIYDTFIIEERFGFNTTTPRTFILDKLKGWILGGIIGGGLLLLIVWFYEVTGAMFWIYAWAAATLFSVFMAMFYSTLIVPLFNKQKPLPEGELRDAIFEFSKQVNFKLRNIFVIDGSKRSTKANAYFTGLGSKKRIVLYDTLIKDLSKDEIVAVLAHETGHYKKRHIQTGMLTGILQTGLTLFILSLLIDNPALSAALGSDQASFHLGLIAFGILYSPISMVTGLIMNSISRKNEYAADHYAKQYHQAISLVSALKKLTSKNLSNLTPHPAYVFFNYSHPPLLQRVKALKNTG